MAPDLRLAILGPTASGKSALAARLAARLGGTVVNGDPFQAYRGLAIGTGQPTVAERAGVPHVGYGELDLAEAMNPAAFGAKVRAWMDSCERPILVTGSGLYLQGIWNQLTELPQVPAALTERVRSLGRNLGWPVLHRYLRAVDPDRARALHPNDGARIQRALALHLATGRRPSELLPGVGRGVPEGWRALVVLPARPAQMERVERRVRAMVAQGWAAEVARLAAEGHEPDLRRLRPLGYEAWLDDPEGAEARIVRETQAYAKRQGTWFRNQWPELPRWDPDDPSAESRLQVWLGTLSGYIN
jgi:tRNA dimethylallyltransferase